MKTLRLFYILLFFVANFFAVVNVQASEDLLFDSATAFSELDKVKNQVVAQPEDLITANLSLEKMEGLQSKAEVCAEKANTKLEELTKLLDNLNSIKGKANFQKQGEFKYLDSKKNYYIKQAVDCRIFLFQSQEVLTNLRESIQEVTTEVKLKRVAPAWTLLGMAERLVSDFNVKIFYKTSGMKSFTNPLLLAFGGVILIFLILGFFIRYKCSSWLGDRLEMQRLSVSLVAVIRRYIVPVFLFGSVSGFLAVVFFNIEPTPLFEYISYILLGYFLGLAFLRFLFYPPQSMVPFIIQVQAYGRSFFVRLNVLLILLLLTGITVVVFSNQDLSPQLLEIARSIFLGLLAVNVVWIAWLFAALPLVVDSHKKYSIAIKVVLAVLLVSIISMQALGYYRLASDIIFGTIFIILALVSFGFTVRVVKEFENFLNNRQGRVSQVIRHHLGLKYSKDLTEFVFVKISIYIFALYGLVLVGLFSFGASLNYIETFNKGFMSGVLLGKIKIIPFQIILSMFVFGVQLIFGLWLKTVIVKKHRLYDKKDTQDAMASLFSYLNFFLALIIALIVAGIDLTSLTVVVGALSVGIGLGLQDVVNNFISGIILLVEKPIKSGDRVVVDGQEGFVKRIRLRSTRIKTLTKKDIIIPNSTFINKEIINYTYSEDLIGVCCSVGVSYNSDIDLVKKVLIETAIEHPEVISEDPNKPTVLFSKFADSSLKFDLYFTIGDVNKMFAITSDVNSMIYKAFKKHQIDIAYPQLDVHMK